MDALFWIAGIVILIIAGFKIGGVVAGYGITAFWVIWTLGFSSVFVGYTLTGPLAIFQLIFIIITFLYSKSELQKKRSQEKEIKVANSLVEKLKKDLSRIDNDYLKKNIDNLNSKDISIIDTPQKHRVKLLSSLAIANRQIIILSGWVMSYSVNEEFRNSLKKALTRGVDVFIGYGYQSQTSTSKEEVYNKAENNLKDLQQWSSTNKTKGILEIFYYPNHSKILICDNKYAIYGSFNWLSNGGGTENEERSCIIYKEEFVETEASKIITSLYDPTKPQSKRQLIKRFLPFSRY
jgi:phosphatidylserine/phosphatidylglycerophosphate/cardiolipin synthase-like enzyme